MNIRDKELESLRSELVEMQQKLSALVGEDVDLVKDQVKEYWDRTASSLRDRIDQSVAQCKGKIGSVSEQTQTYVKENPWQAVAAGLLVGMIVGGILMRERR